MKTNTSKAIAVISALLLHICIPTSLAANDDYKLVWQDNFEGNILDEENNWSIEIDGGGNGNRELQYYRKENISIGKEPESGINCLIITAKKENYSGRSFTSGRLTTQNKMSFKYGKIESRIKLPKTENGLWPAFWLLGADFPSVGWPRSGEIDIMEMGNSDGIKNGTQDRFFNGACHWGYYQPAGWYPSYGKHVTNSYGLQDDFHLFTLIWDSESIRMYLDLDKYPNAEPYYEMGITGKSSDIDPYYYFSKQYFVILNLAVGGNFTQLWDTDKITALSGGEAKMYVDYVRVYQKGEDGEEYVGVELNTGIKNELADEPPHIYPNPAEDYINIKSGKEAKQVSIISLSGQTVSTTQDTNMVNISSLYSGYYIVSLTDSEGHKNNIPLIKK